MDRFAQLLGDTVDVACVCTTLVGRLFSLELCL